jgi:hypothetical protein
MLLLLLLLPGCQLLLRIRTGRNYLQAGGGCC